MRSTSTALAILIAFAGSAAAQGAPRLVITPSTRSVVAGDSVQFSAQLVDESGKPVPDARVTWRSAGFPFEGRIDSTGKFVAGAVGTLPITAIAVVPGAKPIIQRLEIAMVPGPATQVDVSPRPTRLAIGQSNESVLPHIASASAQILLWPEFHRKLVAANPILMQAAPPCFQLLSSNY